MSNADQWDQKTTNPNGNALILLQYINAIFIFSSKSQDQAEFIFTLTTTFGYGKVLKLCEIMKEKQVKGVRGTKNHDF